MGEYKMRIKRSKVFVISLAVMSIIGWTLLFACYGLYYHIFYYDETHLIDFRKSQIEHLQEVADKLRLEVKAAELCCRWDLVITDALSKHKVVFIVLEEKTKKKIQGDFDFEGR